MRQKFYPKKLVGSLIAVSVARSPLHGRWVINWEEGCSNLCIILVVVRKGSWVRFGVIVRIWEYCKKLPVKNSISRRDAHFPSWILYWLDLLFFSYFPLVCMMWSGFPSSGGTHNSGFITLDNSCPKIIYITVQHWYYHHHSTHMHTTFPDFITNFFH